MPTVLISGASRGIGLGLAQLYSAAGWRVIGTARTPASATALAALPGVVVEELDVTSSAAIDALAQKYASTPIDVLISNAGVAETIVQDKLALASFEEYRKIFDTNVYGATKVAIAFVPSLRLAPGSKVVAISSLFGSIGEPSTRNVFVAGVYFYRASKAAVNATFVTLAHALKDEGITCAVISPGWVRTDMGGPDAPLSLEESVTGIKKVIDNLTFADTGHFLGYNGENHPW